jgi:hypothetical protein
MTLAAKNLDPDFIIGPDLSLTGWRLHLRIKPYQKLMILG